MNKVVEDIAIKNMVCDRCISTVKNIATKLKIPFNTVKLGVLSLDKKLNKSTLTLLENELQKNGFELVTDPKIKIINQVKTIIINLIYQKEQLPDNVTMSNYLGDKIGISYSKLSKLFSVGYGKTIEQYTIEIKIERAKELLTYGELNISEVSHELDYNTTQHFSRQFKSITGTTPSQFKRKSDRVKLDTF